MALEPYLDQRPTIDPAAFVHPSATIIGRVRVGPQCSIWPQVVMRGDVAPIRVGAQTSIQDGSVVHATGGKSQTTVGDRVTVGHSVILHGCTVEDECLIGMGAIVMDNVHVGRGSVIGAGSVVTVGKTIPPGSLVYGNPARVVRPCGEAEEALIEEGWRSYVQLVHDYRGEAAPAEG